MFFNISSSETAVGCPDHNNRPLEFYDKDVGQPVCSHCVVIGERQTHAIVPIDEVVSNNKKCFIHVFKNLVVFCCQYGSY